MNLICPRCLANETIRLDVCDGDTMACAGCEEEFTVADVRAVVDGWSRVLPWLEAHPARRPQPAAAG